MKRIAVFGATGQTGKHLVAQALANGHFVRAIVRNSNKLKECLSVEQVQEDHPNLEIWLVQKYYRIVMFRVPKIGFSGTWNHPKKVKSKLNNSFGHIFCHI